MSKVKSTFHMGVSDLWKYRTAVIATMHRKETVMAPILKNTWNLNSIVPDTLNTDEFGTFSGEIPRLFSALEVARLKCNLAIEKTGCDIAIASEGSFGPHPTVLFSHADTELVMLMDRKNDFEFSAFVTSPETNFSASEIGSRDELNRFASQAKFPSHALILRRAANCSDNIFKGISHEKELQEVFDHLQNQFGSVYVETDMRAMHNPTRLHVIESAMWRLVERIESKCPHCKAPYFVVQEVVPGLPCIHCHLPTASTLYHLLRCNTCDFAERRMHPHGKEFEDPQFCNFCNP